jgi:hypothetical protein
MPQETNIGTLAAMVRTRREAATRARQFAREITDTSAQDALRTRAEELEKEVDGLDAQIAALKVMTQQQQDEHSIAAFNPPPSENES